MIRHLIWILLTLTTMGSWADGVIALKLVHPRNDELQRALTNSASALPGYSAVTVVSGGITSTYWINRRPEFTDRDIENVLLRTNDNSEIYAVLLLKPQRARLMAVNPDRYVNRPIAVEIGSSVFIAPALDHLVSSNSISLRSILPAETAKALFESLKRRKPEPEGPECLLQGKGKVTGRD